MSRALKWATAEAAGITLITSVPTTITASGASDPITLEHVERVTATAVVAGVVTGSSPTLDFVLATRDGLGNWLPVLSLTRFTAAGLTYGTAGPGTANVYPLGEVVRFQWTIGGSSTPTFPTVSLSLIGR